MQKPIRKSPYLQKLLPDGRHNSRAWAEYCNNHIWSTIYERIFPPRSFSPPHKPSSGKNDKFQSHSWPGRMPASPKSRNRQRNRNPPRLPWRAPLPGPRPGFDPEFRCPWPNLLSDAFGVWPCFRQGLGIFPRSLLCPLFSPVWSSWCWTCLGRQPLTTWEPCFSGLLEKKSRLHIVKESNLLKHRSQSEIKNCHKPILFVNK